VPQIADLIQPIYEKNPQLMNLLTEEAICNELARTYEPLKDVVKLAIDANATVPAISASLEYLKAVALDEPTSFEEAQLDAFGDHMFS
jgi:6-phosphogluconate dehydrogenase